LKISWRHFGRGGRERKLIEGDFFEKEKRDLGNNLSDEKRLLE